MNSRHIALVYSLLLIAACSPTYNWREVREDAAQIKMLLPCKADEGQRELPLLEGEVVMVKMIGCKAGDLTFTLAWADVLDAQKAEAALSNWQKATLATAKAKSKSRSELVLQGRSVHLNSGVLDIQGTQATGESIEMRGLWFARDALVFQALVIGSSVPEALTEPFFSGLAMQ